METLEDVIRPGTRRGLDFVIVEELRKRTGIMPTEILKFAMAEILCNSLDTDATIIDISVQTKDYDFVKLIVRDNGTKQFSLEDVKLILDFENKASSKRGFLRVSRGYLGNALKCIFGYCYALAIAKGLKPPEIVVESGLHRYTINLKADLVREFIDSEIVVTETENPRYTTFIVKLPWGADYEFLLEQISTMENIVFATSMVNPTRLIRYNFDDYKKGSLGSKTDNGNVVVRQQTSILWYKLKQFETLFKDFVRARPDTKLKEFIALFRGFTAKKIIREILQKLNASNHHSTNVEAVQFFPATPISQLSQTNIIQLFRTLRSKAKPISKRSITSLLGCIGEETFEALREAHGWKRLRYTKIPAFRVECPNLIYGDCSGTTCTNEGHAEFPYIIEIAVFDRDEDGEGLKVFQCVNFMASMRDIFSRMFNIHHHLGRVGVTKDTPVTVIAHLVCPVLNWLNYGKSGLDE